MVWHDLMGAQGHGAWSDGLHDDTAAIQRYLNEGGSWLGSGTYLISSTLTIPGDNLELTGDNVWLKAATTGMTMLSFTGSNVAVKLGLDGDNKASHGIKGTGPGATIQNCTIKNIYSATNTARAIEITTDGGATIRDNVIRNVTSVGDATFGNGPGFARAIVLTSATAATAKSFIVNNVIDNIVGEEGDGIATLFHDGTSNPFLPGNVTISGNEISNVSRRFIKVQSSDTRIADNTLTHGGTVPTYPSNALDLIQSDNVTVLRNTITPNPLAVGISAAGTSGVRNKNIHVQDNVIRQDDAKNNPSIYLNYVTESIVKDNTVHGGASAVSVGNSVNIGIAGNFHFGGLAAAVSFSANSTNTGVVMRLNTNMNSARTAYVSNAGTGALTELNATRV